MPVRNREDFVTGAIRSVLAQSFGDFELLIIDDGSTDHSAEVVAGIDDPRIRLVRQESNQGIPKTRNRGLDLARGEYLALLDSDDWAYPQRLARQVAYLDRHREVAAVGSWAHRITRDGRPASPIVRPFRPRDVRARILFVSCFKNPTMMARTDVMRAFRYREEFTFCQDIDLWARISAKHALANIPEFLIRYRLGGDSHQSDVLSEQLKTRIAGDQLRDLGIDATPDDVRGHHQLRNLVGFDPADAFIDWCEAWLRRLIEANVKNARYPEPEFSQAAAGRWFRLGLAAGPSRLLTRFLPVPTFLRAAPALVAYGARIGVRHLVAQRPSAGHGLV